MKSLWTDSVDLTMPLSDHPHPQFERDCWQCLNGEWNYHIATRGEKWVSDYPDKIIVPFAIESLLSGVEKPLRPSDRLWYEKKFTVDEALKGKRIILHFEAVDWQCKVYVNKEQVGSHTGGYCAFGFDITDYLVDGENTVNVCVYDPTESGWQQRGKQDNHPHGFWYTATSGIWQTVWLEGVSEARIESFKLLPDIDNGTVNIKSKLTVEEFDAYILKIFDGDTQVFSEEISLDETVDMGKDFKLWSPEEPNLYSVILELYRDGKLADKVKSYFGMRKFNIAKDKFGVMRLFLNNEPYFQRGLLDQGYWPDGGLTAPTDEAMIFDIEEMKRLGFNMLRKHIKIESMRWYYHCDRLGMIVWQDMMSGGAYIGDFYAGVLPNLNITVKDTKYSRFKREKKEARDDYKRELAEMIDQLYNVVSIYCWVPFNEGWGQFDAVKICKYVKNLDSSRVVDHASGWYDQGGGDIKSMHKYVVPIKMPKLDGRRAFVITEFGGYQNRVSNHCWTDNKSFGMYLKFKNKTTLTNAYKKLFVKQILPLIDKGLCGTIYTQVCDVENELNGIYTYDRKELKIEEEVIKAINSKLKL
ncbi:MAG: glycoside hydrolase family 2 TIM barrel-domain containing protein [Clostridiaceae bacterium]|nr:glycoside hydrolase family 2 TIM barrel-domain containing protein [Clostridiaceae bacterium]